MKLNNMDKYDSTDKLEKLSRYLSRGTYQDFEKMKLLKICLYFCLTDILLSQVASIFMDNERMHFLKEIGRWSMNIVFSLLSYLMGRKQERDHIKGKLHTHDNNEEIVIEEVSNKCENCPYKSESNSLNDNHREQ